MSNSEVYLTRDEIEHPYANLAVMLEDKHRKAEQMSKTVFASITKSPEMLAETLVYCEQPEYQYSCASWRSVVLGSTSYARKSEALAATLAKLKEVAE